ncbi:MAG TPA: hypothetical protein PKN00_20980, partial [Sedimentisphaerales bacterium]|nr:hypothetical protein [Sedimentisphaerales bacterium]
GLVAGTQTDAMRQFKGGEPNRRPGGKARLTAKLDPSLAGTNTVIVPQSALDTMAAEPGDLLYADDVRWWYGGLHSVHVRAGLPAHSKADGQMLISPQDADTAHFADGQKVVVEKIL